MSLLIRKINRNHWPDSTIDLSDIRADAITLSMRTSRDAMSVYEIPSLEELDEAVLAIASNFQCLEAFDVVSMDKQRLIDLGLNCVQTPGKTPVQELQSAHHDISNLCYGKLGMVATYIASRVLDKYFVRRTRGQLKDILNKAIQDGRLYLTSLDERLQQDLH